MPKGGARGRSGPPPDPNALKRDKDQAFWESLPRDGREGDPPEWPLENQTERESELWVREWARPQAVMWERNSQELEVAMYVRSFASAEQMNATVAARTLVRQQQEALGISLPGLLRNKWKIEEPSKASAQRKAGRASKSARDRFKVVEGGAAG
jgi:hypothetical protein